MNRYIELLKHEKVLKRLSIVQLLAYFGAWFSNVAIYTLLIQLGVSAEVVAFVAMLHFLAGIVQAPFSGSLIDRIKPKKLMLILLIVEIGATFSLIFVNAIDDLFLLYVLIFVKMAAASFYFTTEMSLLPKILCGEKLQMANELHSIIWSFSYTLGMALSGFFVYTLGIEFAFLLDASMFVVCFVLLYTLKLDIEFTNIKESFFKTLRESFTYIKSDSKIIHLMLSHAFVGFSAFDALVALMVERYYTPFVATSLAIGLMHASRALGLVFGPLYLSRFSYAKKLTYIFFAQAFAIVVWALFMHNFYLSLFASVFVGFFTTTLWSSTYTMLQSNTDKKYYGRVVAYNDMLFLSVATFTSFMIGFLASKGFSLESVTVLIGMCFLVGAFYFKWVLKRFF